MSVTLLELPETKLKLTIPTIEPESKHKFFKYSHGMKAVELYLKEQYGIRQPQCTALTTLHQVQQLLEEEENG